MQLIERINALTTRIANHLRDAIMPRLLPQGGTTGQVLGKSSATDYAVGWVTPSAGGGGGAQQVFVQTTRPVTAGPWVWYETDASGAIIDLTVNDGGA